MKNLPNLGGFRMLGLLLALLALSVRPAHSEAAKYVGCYADKEDYPVFPVENDFGPFNSVPACITHCRSLKYSYAALQHSFICYCGDESVMAALEKRPDTECDMKCSGNKSATCGGFWRNAVYLTGIDQPTQANVDCYTGDGEEYVGHHMVTENGRLCIKWSTYTYPRLQDYQYNDMSHFIDTQTGLDNNFCRNPKGSRERPWCSTNDETEPWGYCNVPACSADPCHSQPCQNGGTCIRIGEKQDRYVCSCPIHTSGMNCEELVEATQSFECPIGWLFHDGDCYKNFGVGSFSEAKDICYQHCADVVREDAVPSGNQLIRADAMWVLMKEEDQKKCHNMKQDGSTTPAKCDQSSEIVCHRFAVDKDPCPFGWCHFGGKCYKRFGSTYRSDWNQVDLNCKSDSSQVVEIRNAEEAKFIVKAFMRPHRLSVLPVRAPNDSLLWDSTQNIADKQNQCSYFHRHDNKFRYTECYQSNADGYVCERAASLVNSNNPGAVCWLRVPEMAGSEGVDSIAVLTNTSGINECKTRCAHRNYCVRDASCDQVTTGAECGSFTYNYMNGDCVFYSKKLQLQQMTKTMVFDYFEMSLPALQNCPIGMCAHKGKCFGSVRANAIDWLGANELCRQYGTGGLVTPKNAAELDMIYQTFVQSEMSHLFTGNSDMQKEGLLTVIKESRISEPASPETCFEALFVRQDNYRFDNRTCNETSSMHEIVCEINKKRPSVTITIHKP